MLNHIETSKIERKDGELDGNLNALTRLFARRPPQSATSELLLVGEVEDGANIDGDEVGVVAMPND